MKTVLFILVWSIQMSGAAEVTQWPPSCLKKNTFPCAVHAYKKNHFEFLDNKFFVSKNSLVEFNSSQELTIHQGIVLIQQSGPLKVGTRYGTLKATREKGEVLVSAQGEQWSLRSVDGSFEVKARGADEVLQLHPGHQIVIGPVDFARKSSFVGLPTVIDLKKYLKSIDAVFPYSEMNFQEHVDRVAKVLQTSAYRQAKWDQTIVERKIAQTQESELRQKYDSEYAKKREAYLLRVFRRKNNFEE